MFDLLAVGGTGQCVLLELCFRRGRHPDSSLPRKIWILDRDYGNVLGVTVRRELEALRHGYQWIRPDMEDEAQNLKSLVSAGATAPALVRQMLQAGITERELRQPVAQGFFAMPRVAASWLALNGFEQPPGFLDESYLVAQESVPLCIVGSLAGGTGAGLLPLIVHKIRNGDPLLWRRQIRVIAVLPWFNPGLRPNAPTWDDSCWNAADGVLEFERQVGELRARIRKADPADPTTVAATTFDIIGPRATESTAPASDMPPPNPDEVLGARSFGAFIGIAVDHLFDVVRQEKSTVIAANRERVMLGLGALPAEMLGGSDSSAVRRNRFVAEQLKALKDELVAKREACSVPLGAVLSQGFGSVLGDIILARSLPSVRNQAGFWQAFDERWSARIAALSTGANAISIELARNVGTTIRQIDDGWKQGHTTIDHLLGAANATNHEEKAREIADALVDRLLGEKERQAVDWVSRTATAASFEPIVEVPEHSGNSGTIEGFNSLITYDGPLCSHLAARLRPKEPAFHGASWARLMGQAHKFRSFHEVDSSTDPTRPLGCALLLWKAAVLGLLDFHVHAITEADKKSAWFLAEDFASAFGPELAVVSYLETVVGFISADLGFVPAAELVDHWAEGGGVDAVFTRLATEVAQQDAALKGAEQHGVDAVLEAFCRHSSDSVSRGVAWQRLICPATPRLSDAAQADPKREVLSVSSLPSKRIFLRCQPEGLPQPLRLPLVVKPEQKKLLETIAKTEGARSQFRNEVPELQWRSKHLALIEAEGQDRFIVKPDWAAVDLASRAAGAGNSRTPLFSTTW